MRYRMTVLAALTLIFVLGEIRPARAVDMLYVSMNDNTILRYDTTGNDGATIAATAFVFANSNLNGLFGLAFDASGNLYAANAFDNTISKFNSAGGYLGNIATN